MFAACDLDQAGNDTLPTSSSGPLSAFLTLSDAGTNTSIKVTWVGLQEVAPPSLLFVGPSSTADLRSFESLRTPSLHYTNDINDLQVVRISDIQMRALLNVINSLGSPEPFGDDPGLSVSVINPNTNGTELVWPRNATVRVFDALSKALSQSEAAYAQVQRVRSIVLP
jgi:hypothetical protein